MFAFKVLRYPVLKDCSLFARNCFHQQRVSNPLLLRQTSKNVPSPRSYSSTNNPEVTPNTSKTLFQRFKETYREHGKVFIGCHLVTTAGWVTGFYYLSKSGFDVSVAIYKMHSYGIIGKETADKLAEKITNNPKVQHYVSAYVLYKLVTPLRYLVTIGTTKLAIDFLRKTGYMKPRVKGTSIREIVGKRREERVQRGAEQQKKKS